MRPILTILLAGSFALASAAQDDKRTITYIDLQPKSNQKLDEPLHSGIEGNDLAELPRGEQTMAKVKFKIGAGLIQLGSTILKDHPEKVEGIVVDRKLARLHFLHACGYGSSPPDNQFHVKEDTPIGAYIVHYDDKTMAKVPIVYGKDVRDWYDRDVFKDTPRAKLAWEGLNARVRQLNNTRLYLYRGTWENPHPDKRVVRIDYVSSNDTPAAPFCVAITAEGK